MRGLRAVVCDEVCGSEVREVWVGRSNGEEMGMWLMTAVGKAVCERFTCLESGNATGLVQVELVLVIVEFWP